MSHNDLIQTVSRITFVPFEEMVGKYRGRHVVEARHLAIYFVKMHCGYTLSKVARIFNRDHATVIYAMKMVASLRSHSEDFSQIFKEINDEINFADYAPVMLAAKHVSPYVLPGLKVFTNNQNKPL